MELIVTTPERLRELIADAVKSVRMAQLPPEAAELEVIRRKKYLTSEEVCKLYPLNINTLRKHRVDGSGPVYIKDGSRVLYAVRAVEEYLDARQLKTYDNP